MFQAVAQNGNSLFHASEDLRDEKDVVLGAVVQNGGALFHDSERLRADKDVVLQAVAQNGGALFDFREVAGRLCYLCIVISCSAHPVDYVDCHPL